MQADGIDRFRQLALQYSEGCFLASSSEGLQFVRHCWLRRIIDVIFFGISYSLEDNLQKLNYLADRVVTDKTSHDELTHVTDVLFFAHKTIERAYRVRSAWNYVMNSEGNRERARMGSLMGQERSLVQIIDRALVASCRTAPHTVAAERRLMDLNQKLTEMEDLDFSYSLHVERNRQVGKPTREFEIKNHFAQACLANQFTKIVVSIMERSLSGLLLYELTLTQEQQLLDAAFTYRQKDCSWEVLYHLAQRMKDHPEELARIVGHALAALEKSDDSPDQLSKGDFLERLCMFQDTRGQHQHLGILFYEHWMTADAADTYLSSLFRNSPLWNLLTKAQKEKMIFNCENYFDPPYPKTLAFLKEHAVS
jgi:hypothetical protein